MYTAGVISGSGRREPVKNEDNKTKAQRKEIGSTHEIPLRVAQNIIDIMNDAAELDTTSAGKAEFLLRHLQQLLQRSTYSNITLMENLRRTPSPKVLKRLSYATNPEYKPIFDDDVIQVGIDLSSPLFTLIVPQLLSRPRVPFVMVCTQDVTDRPWLEHVFRPTLSEHGYEDGMIAAWSSTPDHAISMLLMQRVNTPAFTRDDRATMALMLRAIAPFVDREIFSTTTPLDQYDLTQRQGEVLLLLLAGDSEKEIAKRLHRSVHTVHTFVKQLHEIFEVSSRGELMARFIDETISRAARERKQAGTT